MESLARIYNAAGAAALSVLTEDKFFMGKPPFVRRASEEGLIDMERGAKVSGARFYFLTGDGALLQLAMLQLAARKAVDPTKSYLGLDAVKIV